MKSVGLITHRVTVISGGGGTFLTSTLRSHADVFPRTPRKNHICRVEPVSKKLGHLQETSLKSVVEVTRPDWNGSSGEGGSLGLFFSSASLVLLCSHRFFSQFQTSEKQLKQLNPVCSRVLMAEETSRTNLLPRDIGPTSCGLSLCTQIAPLRSCVWKLSSPRWQL